MNDELAGQAHGEGSGAERHPETEAMLRHLDPGRRDPGYWLRFHAAVMHAARDELARRRMTADVTVSELVTSWGRALVPAAVMAAAAAALLLFRPAAPTQAPLAGGAASPDVSVPVALEEMLGDRDRAREGRLDVTFAAEGF